jgi:hypothetical protein
LPSESFELARWSRIKVGADCHVKVSKALYSVPWRLIGTHVDAKETGRRVERGKQTDWNDYPPEKVAFFMRTPTWCRRRAAEIGPSTVDLVECLIEPRALHRLRSAQWVLRLAERTAAKPSTPHALLRCRLVTPRIGPSRASWWPRVEVTRPAAVVPSHLHGPLRLFADEEAIS